MSDNRRDQLIEFVEREFIGPDPIDWPGMTQSNGQEILASDPPRTRYIAVSCILQKPLTIRQTSRMTNVNCWTKQMEKMWKSSPKSLAMVQ